jgi:hypothetical protein
MYTEKYVLLFMLTFISFVISLVSFLVSEQTETKNMDNSGRVLTISEASATRITVHEIFGNSDIVVNDNFEMSSQYTLKNVIQSPVSDSDAVSRSYADSRKLKLSGDSPLEAPLYMDNHRVSNVGEPSFSTDGVPKNYVDNLVRVDGTSVITGDINMPPNRSVGLVRDPLEDSEIATLNYAETIYADTTHINILGGNSMLGSIDMNTFAINDVKAPSNPQDGINLNYLNSNFVPVSGTLLIAPLDANFNTVVNVSDPTNPEDAMTKNYADTNYFLSGGSSSMLGPIDMGNNNIENLLDPTNSTDVATKSYVDANETFSSKVFINQQVAVQRTSITFDNIRTVPPNVVVSRSQEVGVDVPDFNFHLSENVTEEGFDLITVDIRLGLLFAIDVYNFHFLEVNGNAAVFYITPFGLFYSRNTGVGYNTWMNPILLDSNVSAESPLSAILLQNGYPAVAYWQGVFSVRFTRATDVSGLLPWASPIEVGNANTSSVTIYPPYSISMTLLDNNLPILVAWASGKNGIFTSSARDINGSSWLRLIYNPNFLITQISTLLMNNSYLHMIGANEGFNVSCQYDGGLTSMYGDSPTITQKGIWDPQTNTPFLTHFNGVNRYGWVDRNFYEVIGTGSHDFGSGPISFTSGDKVWVRLQPNGHFIWEKYVGAPTQPELPVFNPSPGLYDWDVSTNQVTGTNITLSDIGDAFDPYDSFSIFKDGNTTQASFGSGNITFNGSEDFLVLTKLNEGLFEWEIDETQFTPVWADPLCGPQVNTTPRILEDGVSYNLDNGSGGWSATAAIRSTDDTAHVVWYRDSTRQIRYRAAFNLRVDSKFQPHTTIASNIDPCFSFSIDLNSSEYPYLAFYEKKSFLSNTPGDIRVMRAVNQFGSWSTPLTVVSNIILAGDGANPSNPLMLKIVGGRPTIFFLYVGISGSFEMGYIRSSTSSGSTLSAWSDVNYSMNYIYN